MDEKETEQKAKAFADFVEKKINEFLQKEASEQLIIRDSLPYNSPLKGFIVDILNNWEELTNDKFLKHRWVISENKLWEKCVLCLRIVFRNSFILVFWKLFSAMN
jgi:hypothetical protein